MVQYWLGCGLASHYTQEAVSLFCRKQVCVWLCAHTHTSVHYVVCVNVNMYTLGVHM